MTRREKRNAQARARRAANPDRPREQWRSYARRRTPEQRRSWALKKNYGITIDDYNRMYAEQHGSCVICRKSFPVLDVDHNHETGKVRGLLCKKCNKGLGHFDDQPVLLFSAIDYLNRS